MRYLKKNIKIIIAIFIFVFSLIITNFLINLTINKQCKSSNILSSIIDLGISHIYDCSSIEGVKNNIKIALKENPLFYNFAKKIWDKNKYATGGENKQLLKISNNSSDNIFKTNPELIKGIIGYDDKNLNYQYQEDVEASEYNSWLRSHGGNLNLKYKMKTIKEIHLQDKIIND